MPFATLIRRCVAAAFPFIILNVCIIVEGFNLPFLSPPTSRAMLTTELKGHLLVDAALGVSRKKVSFLLGFSCSPAPGARNGDFAFSPFHFNYLAFPHHQDTNVAVPASRSSPARVHGVQENNGSELSWVAEGPGAHCGVYDAAH